MRLQASVGGFILTFYFLNIIAGSLLAGVSSSRTWLFNSENEQNGSIAHGFRRQPLQAAVERFPYFATLLSSTGSTFCGGALLRGSWVIVAAHCVADVEGDITVRFKAQGKKVFNVASTFTHPGFAGNVLVGSDVALLKLSEAPSVPSVQLTTKAVPNDEFGSFSGGQFNALFFEEASGKLKRVRGSWMTSTLCRSLYAVVGEGDFLVRNNEHFCGRSGVDSIDGCLGDSGGPVVTVDDVDDPASHTLYGTLSFGGKGCFTGRGRTAPFVAVNLGLSQFKTWIKETIDNYQEPSKNAPKDKKKGKKGQKSEKSDKSEKDEEEEEEEIEEEGEEAGRKVQEVSSQETGEVVDQVVATVQDVETPTDSKAAESDPLVESAEVDILSSGDSGMKSWQVGVMGAVIALVIIALLAVVFILYRRRKKPKPPAPPPEPSPKNVPSFKGAVSESGPSALKAKRAESPFGDSNAGVLVHFEANDDVLKPSTQPPRTFNTAFGSFHNLKMDVDVKLTGRKLGNGAFGEVQEGMLREGDTEHWVAVKFVNSDKGDAAENLLNELHVFDKVGEHANVVRCFGGWIGSNDGMGNDCYLVEELMDTNMSRVIHSIPFRSDTTFSQLIGTFQGVTAGLRHLHSHNVVHFDLKPDNVLMGEDLVPKLADFGCSKQKAKTYITANFAGTMAYMAPECMFGAFLKNVQVRAEKIDVFSLGVLMWESVTGKMPPSPFTMAQSLTSTLGTNVGSANDQASIRLTNSSWRKNYPIEVESCGVSLQNLIWECVSFYNESRPGCENISMRLEAMLAEEWAANLL